MRVSDADREATAAEIREHYAAGRLTADELDERLDQAFAARTQSDLGAVMHDLPSLRPGSTPLAGAGQPSSGAGWTGLAGRTSGPGGQGGYGGPGPDGQGAWGPGRAISSVITSLVAVCVLAVFAVTAAFGFGHSGGRPIGIALIIAALAMLRRLLFGRRRRAARGRARRRC